MGPLKHFNATVSAPVVKDPYNVIARSHDSIGETRQFGIARLLRSAALKISPHPDLDLGLGHPSPRGRGVGSEGYHPPFSFVGGDLPMRDNSP